MAVAQWAVRAGDGAGAVPPPGPEQLVSFLLDACPSAVMTGVTWA